MEYKILEEMFKGENPKSIFELGCANGGLLKDLKDHYPDVIVGGMDFSETLFKSKELFPDYTDNFYYRSLTDPFPIPDKSYDVVFCVGVFMYLFDPLSVLRECLRISDNLILAEYHHPQIDFCGQVTRGYVDSGKIQMGIIRDYVTLFHVLGIPGTLTTNNYQDGKTIIKFTKNV